MSFGRILNFHSEFPPPSAATDRLPKPPLRRFVVLCDQLVRSLRSRTPVLPTGAFLLLGVLFLYELYLDRSPTLYV